MFYNYTPNIQIDLTKARASILGDVSKYIDGAETRIHSKQPSLFFRVPAVLQAAGAGLAPVFKATLAEAFPGFKVFLAAWHLGDVSLVAAFHMQDPRTRELLEASLESGFLSSAIAFEGSAPSATNPRVQVLWHQGEIDLHHAAELGEKTQNIVPPDQWMPLTSILMVNGLKALGVDEAQRKGGSVFLYHVVPQDGWTDLHRDYGLVRES